MKKPLFYILIIYFAFSCKNSPEKQLQISDQINSEIQSDPPSVQIEKEQRFSINELIEIIDSIYQIDTFTLDSINLDTVKTFYAYHTEILIENEDGTMQSDPEFESRKEKYLPHPLYAFSPRNAKYLFEYGTFSVLQFNNDSLAKSAFTEIFELFIKEQTGFKYTADSIRLFYDVFSKGGCSYFYKDEFIIHKYRRCNDNYREHENYENALIDFLYPKHLPENGGYFMRFCCSCPEHKTDEYR